MNELAPLFCLVPLGVLVFPFLIYIVVQQDKKIGRLTEAMRRVRSDLRVLESRMGLLEKGDRPELAPPSAGRVAQPAAIPAPDSPEATPPKTEAPVEDPPAPTSVAPPAPKIEQRAARPKPSTPPVSWSAAERPKRTQPREDRAGIEELLGTRLYVWLGAIALALAGIFLVRYAIDQGWLGPAVRVALGILLGLTLLGSGEGLRRVPRIGSALSAAGIAVLFASFYSAAVVYALISPLAGFLLMALTAGTGVLLSLRQDQIVAVVGLAGGYLTPLLVQPSEEPSRMLFAYLSLLLLAILAVSRQRDWWHLSAVSLGAGLLWAMIWPSGGILPTSETLLLGFFVLGSLLAFVLASSQRVSSAADAADSDEPAWQDFLGYGSLGASLLVQLSLVAEAGYSTASWFFVGLIGAAALILGRLRDEDRGLPVLGAVLSAWLLLVWAGDVDAATQSRFLWTVAAFGALYACGAWIALWGTLRPAWWSALAAVSAIGFFLLAYVGLDWGGGDLPWGKTAAGLAVIVGVACLPLVRRRAILPRGNAALAYLAAAATALLSLAIPLELPDEWLAVAWSLEILALVWLAWRLTVPELRWWVWPLAAVVGISLLGPWVLGYDFGSRPVFNWLLYGYGVPVLALAAGAHIVARSEDTLLAEVLEWSAVILTTVMVALQVRHYFSPANPIRFTGFDYIEASTYGIAWLLLALGLRWAGRRWPLPIPTKAPLYLTGLALASVLFLQLPGINPLWDHAEVGRWPLVNWLLYAYGLPALLGLVAARQLAADEAEPSDPHWPTVYGIASLVLVWILVTLEVRQLFYGNFLDRGDLGYRELSSYGMAWLLLAMGLPWIIRRWSLPIPRQVSLVLVGLSLTLLLIWSGLFYNPFWSHRAVGEWPVVNWLLYAYGLPAVLVLLAASRLRSGAARERELAMWVGASSLILALILVTLEVRQLFHGNFLDTGSMSSAENYSYSLAWVVFGSLLLVVGVNLGNQLARWASLPVMLIAVSKVFLYDTASLGGIYRVLSFLGLGLSLILLGWIYQRFVFKEETVRPITT